MDTLRYARYNREVFEFRQTMREVLHDSADKIELVYCAGNSWQIGRADAEVRMPYRRPTALVLSEAERGELEGWARRRRTAQALALRARIVLRSADGSSNTAIAHELGIAKHTVGKAGH